MGPKKKPRGKASKLARMTEEEKQRYLQHRAAVEQEAARRKQQLVSTFLKNKLKHEEGFTRLNSAKINQQWRQTLRHIKCKELRDATETLRQTFNVAIQTKNKIIDNLLADLKDSETQHAMAVEFHLEAIEKLIVVHKERLRTLNSHYIEARSSILDNATIIRDDVKNIFKELESRIETVLLISEKEAKQDIQALKDHKTEKEDEIIIKLMWEKSCFEEKSSECTKQLEIEVDAIKKTYLDSVKPVKRQYMNLKLKCKDDQALIDNNSKIISKYQSTIVRLNKWQELMATMREIKVRKLSETYEGLNKYKGLRRGFFTEESKIYTAKLTYLVAESDSALKYLKKIAHKADQMRMVIKNCQKYLTIKEKILPTFSSNTTLSGSKVDNMEVVPNGSMKHFWSRHSEVVLECNYLMELKRQYHEENEQLKSIMRHYLKCISGK